MSETTNAGGGEAKAAAEAEYARWDTGFDSSRPRGSQAFVCRHIANGWTETTAHPSEDDASAACHKQALDAAVDAALTAPSPEPGGVAAEPVAGLERVRHIKRGFEYEVLGEAEGQVACGSYSVWPKGADPSSEAAPLTARLAHDGSAITVYRCTSTGKLWWRFTDEFRDGRFVTLAAAPPPPAGGGETQDIAEADDRFFGNLEATYPAPTEADLADPQFNAVWQAIKSWDVNVRGAYTGYCGAMGNHVMAVLNAVRSAAPSPASPAEDLAALSAGAPKGPYRVEYAELGEGPDTRPIAFLMGPNDEYLLVDEEPKDFVDGAPSPILTYLAELDAAYRSGRLIEATPAAPRKGLSEQIKTTLNLLLQTHLMPTLTREERDDLAREILTLLTPADRGETRAGGESLCPVPDRYDMGECCGCSPCIAVPDQNRGEPSPTAETRAERDGGRADQGGEAGR